MSKKITLKSIHLVDYKGIESLAAEIDGKHFIVVGHNGAGKTSIFEAISKNSARATDKQLASVPIKMGAGRAVTGIVFQIDHEGNRREIYVETIYRPSGNVMKLIDLANQGELKPPVDKLQEIIGETYDLTPLMDMDGPKQFEELLKVLGGGAALVHFQEEYEAEYDKRTEVNRDIRRLTMEMQQIAPPLQILQEHRAKGTYSEKKPKEEYPQEPDKVAAVMELNTATNKNEQRREAFLKKADIQDEIKKYLLAIKTLEERVIIADNWLNENPEIDLGLLRKKVEVMDKEIEEYKEKMRVIEQHDKTVDAIVVYKAKEAELEKVEKKKNDIEKAMQAVDAKMKAGVASLKLEEIVPELKLLNERVEIPGKKPTYKQGIYYVTPDGELPFNRRQISYAKCIVAIAKLSSFVNNGKLNLIHIPAWNDLDAKSKQELLDFAAANEDLNIQFGIEEVKDEVLGIRLIEKPGTEKK